jgi:hypothetical protein
MEDIPHDDERSSESRMSEAAALPGVRQFVVACPKDVAMFQDAAKTTGLEGQIEVKDLIELVWEAIQAPDPQVSEASQENQPMAAGKE